MSQFEKLYSYESVSKPLDFEKRQPIEKPLHAFYMQDNVQNIPDKEKDIIGKTDETSPRKKVKKTLKKNNSKVQPATMAHI